MFVIEVEISRFVEEAYPGWVECVIVDGEGEKHLFVEKVPVVTFEDLDARSSYPRIGVIACEVVERKQVGDREVVKVDTLKPWAIESRDGQSVFHVLSNQLVAR